MAERDHVFGWCLGHFGGRCDRREIGAQSDRMPGGCAPLCLLVVDYLRDGAHAPADQPISGRHGCRHDFIRGARICVRHLVRQHTRYARQPADIRVERRYLANLHPRGVRLVSRERDLRVGSAAVVSRLLPLRTGVSG